MSLDANSCAYVALYRWSVRSLTAGGQASPWRSLIAVGLTAGARRGIRPDMPRLFRVDNRAARFNPSNVEPRRWVMAGRVTCSDEQENAEQWRNQYGAKGAKWSPNYQRRFLLIKQIEVFGWQSSAACSANPNVNAETATHPCGRLSWLPVSFLLHVKYTLSYRIVHLQYEPKCISIAWSIVRRVAGTSVGHLPPPPEHSRRTVPNDNLPPHRR